MLLYDLQKSLNALALSQVSYLQNYYDEVLTWQAT